MPVDREETLKKAEKLLKQGKVSGAIQEYTRLVEDRPSDWNSANALGDLYVKAGDLDRAADQFRRVADHLFEEGFFPRASAVYKKVLKIKSDDDHSVWRLADVAGRQGLGVDARAYYGRLINARRAAGDERGVTDCIIRLGLLADADFDTRRTAARALVSIGDGKQAARVMLGAGEMLTKQGQPHEALDALQEASQLDPDDQDIRQKLAAAIEAVESTLPVVEQGSPAAPTDAAGTEVPALRRDETPDAQPGWSEPSPSDEFLSEADGADADASGEAELELRPEHDVTADASPASSTGDGQSAAPSSLPLDSVFEALEAQVSRSPREPDRPGGGPGQNHPSKTGRS